MGRTVTLSGDEIYNITSAIDDRIILLEDIIARHKASISSSKSSTLERSKHGAVSE